MHWSRREFVSTVAAGFFAGRARTLAQAVSQNPIVNEMGPKYADWSWPRWKAITGVTPPNISSDQAGREDLVDLLQSEDQPIVTVPGWERKRGEIRKILDAFLGEAPDLKIDL